MPDTDVLSIRFSHGTKERLERLRAALEKQAHGVRVTRAGVIKMLLDEGFKVLEAKVHARGD